MRLALAAVLAVTVLLPPTIVGVTAAGDDRTLTFHHTHTGQTATFTFRRNGQYDQAVLRQMNVFLADWRTKEPTTMDPALFDLLWQIYRDVDASQPIHIVSSYRSPATNAALRKKSSGVAENSQHMRGKAMDIFIPGVNLTRLRETAMRYQVGGVGYYPTSGSPFVHVDTGSVRAWPRMTRAQLKKVFPDGRTLHLPTDGKPLSAEGRRYAELEWKKCHAVPCSGRPATAPTTMLASLDAPPVPAAKPRTLLGTLFGQGEKERPADVQLAALSEPAQRTVTTFAVAPTPAVRPGAAVPVLAVAAAEGAPVPAAKSARLRLATRSPLPDAGATALTAIAAIDVPAPQPRMLPAETGQPNLVTAYAAESPVDEGARLALQMIIERETTASLPTTPKPPRELDAAAIRTASLGGDPGLRGMFDMTFRALTGAAAPAPVAAALVDFAQNRQRNDALETRPVELVAPELDHVNETLVHPVLMSSRHFAVLSESEGYLDKPTELGPLTARLGFESGTGAPPAYDRFVSAAPLLVAAR
ncbi:DUF882 domain-containing protein [Devosia sp.]|uniref:DUF882 domain-containing protein n=1 Tax=Devosia sp. TaxID=1871048 RepID=UPI002EE02A5B